MKSPLCQEWTIESELGNTFLLIHIRTVWVVNFRLRDSGFCTEVSLSTERENEHKG